MEIQQTVSVKLNDNFELSPELLLSRLSYSHFIEMSDSDNPPIGLILCGNKGKALAKYATSGMDNQLFVSKYLVQLPDKKVLENFIIDILMRKHVIRQFLQNLEKNLTEHS